MQATSPTSEPFVGSDKTAPTIQADDCGFLIVGDRCQTKRNGLPLFVGEVPCTGIHPPDDIPTLLVDRIPKATWDDFTDDTCRILKRQHRKRLYFLLLYKGPPMAFILYPRTNRYDYEEYASVRQHNMQQLGYLLCVIIWFTGYLIAMRTCLAMNSERVHGEIEQVRDGYAAKFHNGGVTLLYIREGRAAYWVFRPLECGGGGPHV